MAQIYDRKSNFYSQKQSVRDELSAPQYLESAGDELIKSLVKKQVNTSISLQEQLATVQNFEKGFKLNPDNRKGVTSLEDFKKHTLAENEICSCTTNEKEIRDVDELMKITGLTRHELELGLCEKPKSTVSQLYMFAIKNKRKEKQKSLETMLLDHPINRLKEIEEECFGHTKKRESESKPPEGSQDGGMERKIKKRRKQRKRKKKTRRDTTDNILKNPALGSEPLKNPIQYKDGESLKASSSRLSLWDVKDMKRWSESEQIGCQPQAFYTIKNGKIIKFEEESGGKETT